MPDPIVATKPKESQGSDQQQESSGPSEEDRLREALLKEKEQREKLARSREIDGEEVDVIGEMLAENNAGRPGTDDASTPFQGSIDIADGWSADVAMGKDHQKAEFSAPAEMKFPPPDGFELPIFSVPIGPLGGAPIFIQIDMGLSGGVTLGDLAMSLEHKRGRSDVLRQDNYAVSGGGGIKAEFGIELKLAILVGVPKIANAQAGLKATAGAEAGLKFEAGGHLDVVSTIPAPGGKGQPVSKDGEIYFNIAGAGELAAELAAYLGYEVFTFKGEFFSISIAKAALANLEIGARFGVRYSGGERKFFAEPLTDEYVNFDWLFGKLWRARKLDKAKAKSVEAEGNALALMDIAERGGDYKSDTDGEDGLAKYLEDLKSGKAKLEVVSGEMQLLRNEQEKHERSVKADSEAIAALELKIEELIKKDGEVKAKRWKITKLVRGDIKELKDARKELKNLRKDLIEKAGLAEKASQDFVKARDEFLAGIEIDEIQQRIDAAKKAADAVHKENWNLFTSEVQREMGAYEKRYAKIRDEITETEKVLAIRRKEFADGAGVAQWEAEKQAAVEEEQRLAEVVNSSVSDNEKSQAALDALGPDDNKKKAKKALANGEKKLKGDIAKWEKAQAQKLAVTLRSPLTILTEQISKLEARKLLLSMRLKKLEDDRLEAYLEEAKLLPNVPSVKKKPTQGDEDQ